MANSIIHALKNIDAFLMRKVQRYIPGTIWNTLCRKIDKKMESILDVGCGDGVAIQMLFEKRNNQFNYTGIDIYQASLDMAMEKAKQLKLNSDFLLCDVRQLAVDMKSYDVVVCLEVLEHLNKKDGELLIQKLEEIARKQVILTLPVGVFEQEPVDDKDNPFMLHKSAWYPSEFISRGYSVRGYGLPIVGGSLGFLARLPVPLPFIRRFIWILATSCTYFMPRFAGWMICIKKVNLDS